LFQQMAQGVDQRPVEIEHERKSVGAEVTFPRDLPDGPELRDRLARLAEEVAGRLAKEGVQARTIVLKLRYRDFRTITRQTSRPGTTGDAQEIRQAAEMLLERVAHPGDQFRLLGIHCTHLTAREEGQLKLWKR